MNWSGRWSPALKLRGLKDPFLNECEARTGFQVSLQRSGLLFGLHSDVGDKSHWPARLGGLDKAILVLSETAIHVICRADVVLAIFVAGEDVSVPHCSLLFPVTEVMCNGGLPPEALAQGGRGGVHLR